ncbi:MAG TPA: homocysteine S-methyltransferase family protein [Anaeromyxobacteraceae bacterium]|nr:homocysteine S-methyltransferase family protein [Anaeromyxobacteraceae bacterium]
MIGPGSIGRTRMADGAMGTALIARGLPPARPPEHWVLERPAEVARVHAAHVAAGAEVVLTCTFNAARLDVAARGLAVEDVARRAVLLARAARPRAVAGCTGATGLAAPGASQAGDGELEERHGAAFRALAGAGVDLLWTETHLSHREARAALRAGRRTGLPVVVTVHARQTPAGPAALDGTPALELLVALWRDGAAAVGLNCVEPDAALARLVARLSTRVPVPIVVKPNAGLPGRSVGPWAFAAGVGLAVRAGASVVGGCCGSGDAHLRALARGAVPARARAAGQARG